MGVLDLLSWIGERFDGGRDEGPDPADLEPMAEGASGESVRAEILAGSGEQTKLPITEYLEDGEQPHHMIRAGEVVAVDETDSVARKYPGLETVVVATDRRLLIVIGGHVADDVMVVPAADVVSVDVEPERYRRYLVVEANREGEPMTFFVDATLEGDEEAVWKLSEFLREGGPPN